MDKFDEKTFQITEHKDDRRKFLKRISKYAIGLGVFGFASLFGLRQTGDLRLGVIKNIGFGLSEAHGLCGAGLGCSGGSGQCGAGLGCSGGGGQCGAGLGCGGSGTGDDDKRPTSSGSGQCGAGLGCSGGGGQCGAGLGCSGGGGQCGAGLNCGGK